MKVLVAFLLCVGVGYLAEVYFDNPQDYIVWVGFTVITFGAYVYLTQVTSFAFALPLSVFLVGAASAIAYASNEPGFIIGGVYGAVAVLILLGNRFHSWGWADWKSPRKLIEALSANRR